MKTSDDRPVHTLSDGNQMPTLGLGVWQVPEGSECVNSVLCALELGYRHIDTAQAYRNEKSVGKALRETDVPREDIFITTKFYPERKDPVAEIEKSLERLGVDNVDLYIIHWPQGGPTWAWPGMQKARELGYTRSIGISNFSTGEIEELLAVADVPPVVNQVQFSPFEFRSRLLDACASHKIVLEAYSTLGTGKYLTNKKVVAIAERVGRTPAQVLLRWCLQHDVPVIPKSTHRERIEENGKLFDFELTGDDMAALDALDKLKGTAEAREGKWW